MAQTFQISLSDEQVADLSRYCGYAEGVPVGMTPAQWLQREASNTIVGISAWVKAQDPPKNFVRLDQLGIGALSDLTDADIQAIITTRTAK